MGLRVGALTRSWARRALWAGLRGGKREWAALSARGGGTRALAGEREGAGRCGVRLGRVESWAAHGREREEGSGPGFGLGRGLGFSWVSFLILFLFYF